MVSSSVVNISKTMKEYSNGFRVSPSAVHEMVGRVEMWFETHMQDLCRVSKSHNRCTVSEDDVTEFFGMNKNGMLED